MKTHVVKPKETLTSIAKLHGTTVAALVAANGIPNPDLIHVGDVLDIPVESNQVYNALITCLDAIEQLPEFKQLEKMLYG